mmetsp:Transcript_1277/g.3926  ORF Transcript_1277/g.3926 Transcript_1277/m.3926 type:complete len:88 (-) Transcript_1277:78-341(-)
MTHRVKVRLSSEFSFHGVAHLLKYTSMRSLLCTVIFLPHSLPRECIVDEHLSVTFTFLVSGVSVISFDNSRFIWFRCKCGCICYQIE